MAVPKVFIPLVSSEFGKIVKDPITGELKFELDASWYLLFSRKLGADLLLDGATFAVDQNILSVSAFRPHVPMANSMTNWADDDNILAGQIFGG